MQEIERDAATAGEMQQDQIREVIKVDFTIEDPEERVALVQKIIDNTPPDKLKSGYLQYLATYIVSAMTKKEKKQKKIYFLNLPFLRSLSNFTFCK